MNSKKPTILLSNDDGIQSEGLRTLEKYLKSLGNIYIVAPDREQSAVSHSLTLHRPLRLEKIGGNKFTVNGTPTDCINIAVNKILKHRPNIVISGINKGENLGDDITYSGTVSAAMEATILGIPSFAISIACRNNFKFNVAGSFAKSLVKKILDEGLPKYTFLNVNVPNLSKDKIKGYMITSQGKRIYDDVIIEKIDPRGKKYYWIGGNEPEYVHIENSDIFAVKNDYISITPIYLDLTNYTYIEALQNWGLKY